MLKGFLKVIVFLISLFLIFISVTIGSVSYLTRDILSKDNLSNTIYNVYYTMDNIEDSDGNEIDIIPSLLGELDKYPGLSNSMDTERILKEISMIIVDSIHYQLGLSNENFSTTNLQKAIADEINQYASEKNFTIDSTFLVEKIVNIEGHPINLELPPIVINIIKLLYDSKTLYISILCTLFLIAIVTFINQNIQTGLMVFSIPTIISSLLILSVASLLSMFIKEEKLIEAILTPIRNEFFIVGGLLMFISIILLIVGPKLKKLTQKELVQ